MALRDSDGNVRTESSKDLSSSGGTTKRTSLAPLRKASYGWLEKKGQKRHNWKRRWFFLVHTTGEMFYFSAPYKPLVEFASSGKTELPAKVRIQAIEEAKGSIKVAAQCKVEPDRRKDKDVLKVMGVDREILLRSIDEYANKSLPLEQNCPNLEQWRKCILSVADMLKNFGMIASVKEDTSEVSASRKNTLRKLLASKKNKSETSLDSDPS